MYSNVYNVHMTGPTMTGVVRCSRRIRGAFIYLVLLYSYIERDDFFYERFPHELLQK